MLGAERGLFLLSFLPLLWSSWAEKRKCLYFPKKLNVRSIETIDTSLRYRNCYRCFIFTIDPASRLIDSSMYCYSLTLFSPRFLEKATSMTQICFHRTSDFTSIFLLSTKKSLERACLFRGSTGYHVLNNLSKTFHISPLFRTYIPYWRKIFSLQSCCRFYSWVTRWNLQGNQSKRRRTGSQRRILVRFNCTWKDCSRSMWHGDRRWTIFTTERNAFSLKKMFHFTISAL